MSADNKPGRTTRPLEAADIQPLHAAFAVIGWVKPVSLFERYLAEQEADSRWVRVAVWDGARAGFVTIMWESEDPVFHEASIPEIVDLNVLPAYRRRGIGSRLMTEAETTAATRAAVVGLRVGLHSGYGSAQRLYGRRGYLPDGRGAVRNGVPIPEHGVVELGDDVTLRMTKYIRHATPVRS